MVSGRNENIDVRSSPAGASATLRCNDGTERAGETPVTLNIPRKARGCTVRVSKEGFADETVKLEDELNGKYWINFVTTPLAPLGVVGFTGLFFSEPDDQSRAWGTACLVTAAAVWVIDRRTGAAFEHTPHVIDVALKRKE